MEKTWGKTKNPHDFHKNHFQSRGPNNMGKWYGKLTIWRVPIIPEASKIGCVSHGFFRRTRFQHNWQLLSTKLLIWRVEISRGCTSVSIPNKWSNVANVKSSTFIPSISSLALLVMKFSSRFGTFKVQHLFLQSRQVPNKSTRNVTFNEMTSKTTRNMQQQLMQLSKKKVKILPPIFS